VRRDLTPTALIRRTRREWLGSVTLLVLLALWLGGAWPLLAARSGLASSAVAEGDAGALRWSWPLYDGYMRAQSALGPAAQAGGVIVEVDARSLELHGRWPWPRAAQARLVQNLLDAQPLRLALDLIYSEAETAGGGDGDQRLAEAFGRAQRQGIPILLPMVREQLGEERTKWQRPILALRVPGVSTGHIQVALDEDGVVRRVHLLEGFVGDAPQTYLGAGLAAATLPVPDTAGEGLWWRGEMRRIRFFAQAPGWDTVSAHDVLAGRIDPARLRGRPVLAGLTGAGLADAYPTPGQAGAREEGLTPGVHVLAQVAANLQAEADGLRRNAPIVQAGWLPVLLINLLVPLLLMLCMRRLSPRAGLALSLASALALLLAGFAAFTWAAWWVPPLGVLVACALAWPVWSWRRLEAAVSVVDTESQRLRGEFMPLAPEAQSLTHALDTLDARLSLLMQRGLQARDLRGFLSQAVNELPDAAWVVDGEGQTLMHNRDAQELAARLGMVSALPSAQAAGLVQVAWRDMAPQLEAVLTERQTRLLGAQGFDWRLMHAYGERPWLHEGVSARLPNEQTVLVKAAPLADALGRWQAYIIMVLDLSITRELEAQREQALRFLSHDIRAPQASILALLETDGERMPDDLRERLRRNAASTLALADGFVQLARAQARESYRFEAMNLTDVVQEAIDEQWSAAQAAGVRIELDDGDPEAWIEGDRAMLWRATGNFLSNAIKHSPPGSCIQVSVVRSEPPNDRPQIELAVQDSGPGMTPEQSAQLFVPFSQLDGPERRRGSGLGLAFVRVVAERHRARVGVDAQPGEGARFWMRFVALPPVD
jgi:signal transduction histidine kinase/CHASE2 domain-containing sensor protein